MNFSIPFKQVMMTALDNNFSASAIQVYSGTVPADGNTFLTNGAVNYASYLLATFTGLSIGYVASPISFKLSASKTVAATSTGTATWAVVWPQGTASTLYGVILCGVSLSTGDQPVYLSSLSLVTGTNITLQDFGITVL